MLSIGEWAHLIHAPLQKSVPGLRHPSLKKFGHTPVCQRVVAGVLFAHQRTDLFRTVSLKI